MLSIIIPVFGQEHHTKKIQEEIAKKIKIENEVIIIDGDAPVNAKRNAGVEQAKGEYVRIINNDILLTEGIAETLIALLSDNKVACPYSTRGSYEWMMPLFKPDSNICGWCYMLKKEDWIPIPDQLKIRYGDNRIYEHYKDSIGRGGNVHHYESRTIKTLDIQKILDQDKVERGEIKDTIKVL